MKAAMFKAPQKEALASDNLAFSQLYFLQFISVKSLKIFAICEICPADHLFAVFCFLPLSQIWSHEFLFYQKALGRAQICLTIQQILQIQRKELR